jgi:tRNA G18 (ribose-2'-O)-methylase SpoU
MSARAAGAAPLAIARGDDPRVDAFRLLAEPRALAAAGLFAAEGRLVLERLLAPGARYRLRAVLATPALLERLAEPLRAAPAPALFAASERVIAEVVGHALHRGGVGLAERGAPDAPAALIGAARGRPLLVLENVADPDNLGALFRNAEAFGAGGVLLAGGGADPLYRKAVRASMGAVLALPFARLAAWPGDLAGLARAGYRRVALAPRARLALSALDPAPPTALLLGSEGAGLSEAALAAADVAVCIPIAPRVDSLNVAAAAAIALHHLERGVACAS